MRTGTTVTYRYADAPKAIILASYQKIVKIRWIATGEEVLRHAVSFKPT